MPRASGASKVRTRSTSRPGRLRPRSRSTLCESQRIALPVLQPWSGGPNICSHTTQSICAHGASGRSTPVRQLPLTGEASGGAEALIPERPTLKSLRDAATRCTACPLYENATPTVFGEGLKRARLLLIGEQPGDREAIEGHPFAGPAGALPD